MSTRGRLATILIALTLFGCKGPMTTSAATTGDGGSSGDGVAAAVSSGGTRTEAVPDTTLNNMAAFSVTVPANWKFQGVLIQGGPALCDSLASGVWRTTSPDGLSFEENMPQFLWAYGTGPKPTTGCLPLSGPMSAAEFLKFLSTTMQVEYVGPDAVPESLAKMVKQSQDAAAQPPAPFWAAHNLTPPRNTYDGAAATVRYRNAGTEMKGRLAVFLACSETVRPGQSKLQGNGYPGHPVQLVKSGPTSVNKCTASVEYETAPENRLASVERQWDVAGMGIHSNKEWGNAWVKRKVEQGQKITDDMIRSSWDRFNAQQTEIAHTMAVQQKAHEQFLQTMQEGADRSMARAAEAANSNHRMAQDMVDYSLDRQTVLDTTTGNYYKVTNQLTPGGAVVKTHADGTVW